MNFDQKWSQQPSKILPKNDQTNDATILPNKNTQNDGRRDRAVASYSYLYRRTLYFIILMSCACPQRPFQNGPAAPLNAGRGQIYVTCAIPGRAIKYHIKILQKSWKILPRSMTNEVWDALDGLWGTRRRQERE